MKKGEKLLNAGESRKFYGMPNVMVYDNEPFRLALEKRGETLRDYLDKNEFEYLWLSPKSDPDLWKYAHEREYKEIFTYTFSEGGTDFISHIFFRDKSA